MLLYKTTLMIETIHIVGSIAFLVAGMTMGAVALFLPGSPHWAPSSPINPAPDPAPDPIILAPTAPSQSVLLDMGRVIGARAVLPPPVPPHVFDKSEEECTFHEPEVVETAVETSNNASTPPTGISQG